MLTRKSGTSALAASAGEAVPSDTASAHAAAASCACCGAALAAAARRRGAREREVAVRRAREREALRLAIRRSAGARQRVDGVTIGKERCPRRATLVSRHDACFSRPVGGPSLSIYLKLKYQVVPFIKWLASPAEGHMVVWRLPKPGNFRRCASRSCRRSRPPPPCPPPLRGLSPPPPPRFGGAWCAALPREHRNS